MLPPAKATAEALKQAASKSAPAKPKQKTKAALTEEEQAARIRLEAVLKRRAEKAEEDQLLVKEKSKKQKKHRK